MNGVAVGLTICEDIWYGGPPAPVESAARAQLAAKRGRRPQLPGIRVSDDGIRIGVSVLAAFFAPVMGALLTGYFAYDADQNGRIRMRNLMIALLGLCLVGVFAYAQLWGGIFFGI